MTGVHRVLALLQVASLVSAHPGHHRRANILKYARIAIIIALDSSRLQANHITNRQRDHSPPNLPPAQAPLHQ